MFIGDKQVDPATFGSFEPGIVYSDGSAFNGQWSNAVAAASVVQLDSSHGVAKKVLMRVPAWAPQTAAFAEHLAA